MAVKMEALGSGRAQARPGPVIATDALKAELPDTILDAGAVPVIPPRHNRRRPHAFDRTLYKERNAIERMFAKLKQFVSVRAPCTAGGGATGR